MAQGRFEDLSGKRFGQLLVLSRAHTPPGSSRRPHWNCRCDCGTEKVIVGKSLVEGDVFACGHHKRKKSRITLLGRKFGKLTVIGMTPNRVGRIKWECLCECGRSKIIGTPNLVSGNTKSCGCLRRSRAESNAIRTARHRLLCFYSNKAASLGREFTLSASEFTVLLESNCYYCGSPPSNSLRNKCVSLIYKYNGVDRVNNLLGYIPSNCVPCCAKCNRAKRDMNIKEFAEWVRSAYWNFYVGKMGGQDLETH